MNAISEGSDPTAQDKATFDQQIDSNQIKVLVFNKQSSTPEVQGLVNRAKGKKTRCSGYRSSAVGVRD